VTVRATHLRRFAGLGALVLLGVAFLAGSLAEVRASWPFFNFRKTQTCDGGLSGLDETVDSHGSWFWLRSPEQEKRVVIRLYNDYCRRCHGTDGRGVWDIPDVPDFRDARWQASRSEGQLARLIIEGRGAVMPAFRGTLTLEEAWAMARYLRTFRTGPEPSPAGGTKVEIELPPPRPK
jgi:hypothetical protein